MGVAVPVQGIVVDRQLSDWPETARQLPVATLVRGTTAAGIRGWFRSGYDAGQNTLYIAVWMQDVTAADGDQVHYCHIQIDPSHRPDRDFSPLPNRTGRLLTADDGPDGRINTGLEAGDEVAITG